MQIDTDISEYTLHTYFMLKLPKENIPVNDIIKQLVEEIQNWNLNTYTKNCGVSNGFYGMGIKTLNSLDTLIRFQSGIFLIFD